MCANVPLSGNRVPSCEKAAENAEGEKQAEKAEGEKAAEKGEKEAEKAEGARTSSSLTCARRRTIT